MHHSNWQNLFLSMKSMQEGLAEYYITEYYISFDGHGRVLMYSHNIFARKRLCTSFAVKHVPFGERRDLVYNRNREY